MKRLRFQSYVYDLVDCDYLDKLPEAERDWLRRFLAEYYNGEPSGVTGDVRDAYRRKMAANRDLFARGRRTELGPNIAAKEQDTAELPAEAQRLLAEIRKVRPQFDEADGRRRPRFDSPLAEQRFNQLREQLSALLGRQEEQ